MAECLRMIKKYLYDTEFKIVYFGNGEWVKEPDRVRFTYKKIKCLLERVCKIERFCTEEVYFGGYFCGYVSVPKTHPCYQKREEDIPVDCHGGITFSESINMHLIGFHCSHSGDLIPSMWKFREKNAMDILEKYNNNPILNPVYRNMEYCIEQCKSIVDQLIDMEKKYV